MYHSIITALRSIRLLAVLFVGSLVGSCMDYAPKPPEELHLPRGGAFVISEGNFQYSNSSIEYYHPEYKQVVPDIFARANGRALGDVAQSMVYRDGVCYIVVNNSGVIYIFNPENGRLVGGIKGFTSPRYIHFLSDTKAYVTDLYAGRISIINPRTRRIIGAIQTPEHKSTERMLAVGQEIWVSCWSYDDYILILDPEKDEVKTKILVGKQPTALSLDANGYVWVLSTGGYPGSPHGYEPPSIRRIDPRTREILDKYSFKLGRQISAMTTSPDGRLLYYLYHGDIYVIDTANPTLPTAPLVRTISTSSTRPYGLSVDPRRGDLYLLDAIDYVQAGRVYRYTSAGRPIDTLTVGIIPNALCFTP